MSPGKREAQEDYAVPGSKVGGQTCLQFAAAIANPTTKPLLIVMLGTSRQPGYIWSAACQACERMCRSGETRCCANGLMWSFKWAGDLRLSKQEMHSSLIRPISRARALEQGCDSWRNRWPRGLVCQTSCGLSRIPHVGKIGIRLLH